MTLASEHQRVRERAWSAAASILAHLGFAEEARGQWRNPNIDWGHWRGTVHVVLPADFPFQLPEVLIEDSHEFRPHVDRAGKVCVAPTTGLLLDFTRPARIVEDVLALAKGVLAPASAEVRLREFEREYQSYWETEDGGIAFASVHPRTGDGPLRAEMLPGNTIRIIVSSDDDTIAKWKASLGLRNRHPVPCYYIRLSRPLPVPPRTGVWTLEEFLTRIENGCDSTQTAALFTWLNTTPMPLTLLAETPSGDPYRSLSLAFIAFPESDHVEAKRKRFRPGRFPTDWAFRLALRERIRPLRTERIDHQFLVARAGGEPDMGSASACVIGVGSIGSFFANALARAGVGRLRLIDPDRLHVANLHRHVLGAPSLDAWKAEALASEIGAKLPNIRVEHQAETVDRVFSTNPTFVTECDLVVGATGEESTELGIAMRLSKHTHRLHVWIEPMGLGGHVLVLPKESAPGCLRCLFDHDERGVLTNLASLAAPGQAFQRVLGGCAGSFTPFGASDAQMIAATAAHWATRLLLGRVERPVLVTWANDRRTLVNAGFRLSQRGLSLEDGRMHMYEDFARPGCPVCGDP